MNRTLPRWADIILIPLLNLALAILVAGLVVVFIGEDPFRAMKLIIQGAFAPYGIGFTLYYTTNFIFTGLAVAVAFHARLFNIGGEGQAAMAGVGVALVALAFDWPHWSIALLAASLGGMVFGAGGSHIVITTIMFNLIAASVINFLLVGPMQAPGSNPESSSFPPGASLPTLHDMFAVFGIAFDRNAPVNVSLFMALIACVLVWLLIWKSRIGYEIRAFGHSDGAAVYAGISPLKITMIAMLISGALAGMMAINTVMGEAERLVLDAVQGAGFVGIAVALMGRNHPLGVVLAAFLFGILYQGGSELAFEMPGISREMIVVIQGLVILFTGSLENLVRIPVSKLFLRFGKGGA